MVMSMAVRLTAPRERRFSIPDQSAEGEVSSQNATEFSCTGGRARSHRCCAEATSSLRTRLQICNHPGENVNSRLVLLGRYPSRQYLTQFGHLGLDDLKMRLPGLRQIHDVVLGLRPTSRHQAGQRIAQIVSASLQEGLEFSLQFWYRPRMIFKQIE